MLNGRFSILGILCLAMTASAFADDAPSESYCAPMKQAQNWPLQKIALPENQIAFRNTQEKKFGILGVCWWHSRLQRNAIYLADFHPELPAPSEKEALHLMRKLLRGRTVVAIPGFANLHDFTAAYAESMKEGLNRFRNRSILFKFEWTKKIFRPLSLTDERFEKEMNETKEILAQGDIPFWMLQVGDLGAHSWLITEMTDVPGSIMRVTTVDTNYSKLKSWSHSMRKGKVEGGENFFGVFYVPFNDRKKELKRIRRLAEKKCQAVDVASAAAPDASLSEEEEASVVLIDAAMDSDGNE